MYTSYEIENINTQFVYLEFIQFLTYRIQVLSKLIFGIPVAVERRKVIIKLRKNAAKKLICLFPIFKPKRYIFLWVLNVFHTHKIKIHLHNLHGRGPQTFLSRPHSIQNKNLLAGRSSPTPGLG